MKIISWCVGMFRYYVVFSRPILFILGLIFSNKLVEKTFFDILTTHLSDEWADLRKSAIVVNLIEGIEEVAQIFFTFVADAYTGLFKMMACSTTIYIIGLSLSCFAAKKGEDTLDPGMFYPALLLMTLSHAAQKAVLVSFLRDQLGTEEEEERAQKRSNFLWNSVSFLAAIVALFGLSQIDPLKILSMLLAIAMGASFLWFLLGTKFYTYVEPTGSPLSDVVFVIHSAIVKIDVEYPERIPPHVSWLRWLDRAAVAAQEKQYNIFTVEQVKGVKYLIKMVPMWTAFITYSLVAASGSTFFLEEATSIADDVQILLFTILQRLTEFMVSQVSDYALEKLCKNKDHIAQRMMLVRIGIGMIFCPLCCIAAWINAHHRLHLMRMFGDSGLNEHMSVYRLTPQFVLLAFMQGLSGDGLENFFHSLVSRSISRYGPPFGECVMGVGKFLSVVCILILSRWFHWFAANVAHSRLDKYYAMLASLGSVNIVFYCLVAHWYGDDRFLSGNKVDIETASSFETDQLQEEKRVAQTLTGKGRYSQKSLSGIVVPIEEESSIGDDVTETGQETSVLPDNKYNDEEAEKGEPCVAQSTKFRQWLQNQP